MTRSKVYTRVEKSRSTYSERVGKCIKYKVLTWWNWGCSFVFACQRAVRYTADNERDRQVRCTRWLSRVVIIQNFELYLVLEPNFDRSNSTVGESRASFLTTRRQKTLKNSPNRRLTHFDEVFGLRSSAMARSMVLRVSTTLRRWRWVRHRLLSGN